MNFKMSKSVNLSNVRSYNSNVNKIDYTYNKETYTPNSNSQENIENEYLETENIETNENIQTVPVEEAMNRGLEQNRNNVTDIFENNEIASNAAMAAGGFANGVGNFGENVVDAGVTGVTVMATPFTFLYDQFTGSNVTEEMWNSSNAFVEEEHVNNAFEDFYTNNEIGQAMNENASEAMQYGNTGYNTAVGVGYLTATVASAGTLSHVSSLGMASSGAAISGAAGFGRGTSDALNNGATTQEALVAGGLTGLWEGGQWIFGAKIAGNGLTTVALDAGSGAVDPLARSGIQMIYNDQSFAETFEQNGGVEGMLSNAAIAGGFSAIGEISTIRGNSQNTNSNLDDSKIMEKTYLSDSNIENSSFNSSSPKTPDFKALELDELNAEEKSIIDSLTQPLRDGNISDENVRILLENVEILKKNNSNFQIGVWDSSSGFWEPFNTVGINVNDLDYSVTTLHETGHAFYHNFKSDTPSLSVQPTQRMQDLIQNAQSNIRNNPEKLSTILDTANAEYNHCKDLTIEWYDGISQSENDRIASLVSDLYDEGNTSELTNIVNGGLKYQSIKEDLGKAGLSVDDIDALLSDREAVTNIAQRQNAISQKNQYLNNLMSDPNQGLDARKTFSILNSITQNEQISLPDGRTITLIYGHRNSYWVKDAVSGELNIYGLSYDELMADYFAVSSLGRNELLENLRGLAGDELFDALSNEYGSIVDLAKNKNLM